MQKVFALFTMIYFLAGCSKKALPLYQSLTPHELHNVIVNDISAQIIDVRTPEEFIKGHIPRAKNLQLQKDSASFYSQLDSSRPVYVYCLSGGRSAAAAEKLISKGYTVYEMTTGMAGWRVGNLPEVKHERALVTEMSYQEYSRIVASEKKVLIDFYAKWCGPCVKMKPYLEELSDELKDEVEIIRIDIDENPTLAATLKIQTLPVLKIYKDAKEMWSHTGYMNKEDIRAAALK